MAETNLIEKSDLSRVREVDFALLYNDSVNKLLTALGVTRKVPMQAGSLLKILRAVGTLEKTDVGEGETIPLSHYTVESVALQEITLKKRRKATSAEAILARGYDQAVAMTTQRMLRDVQKDMRADFFAQMGTGTGRASGKGLQAALAGAWGQLQVLFEDDDLGGVFFVNPLDIADYLATANITTQTAFGMHYVENFMGLGTVFMNAGVPRGKLYATACDNLIFYYIPVGGADLSEAFRFTTDESGYIGIHEAPDYTNMTCADTVVYGNVLFAERPDGVVVADITA